MGSSAIGELQVDSSAGDAASEHDGVVRTQDLSISFGPQLGADDRRVLSGVTIDLPRGGILGIVGASGSGKSSLGRVLSGRSMLREKELDWPWISGGDASVAGINLRKPTRDDRRRLTVEVGYLAPESGDRLRNDLTVAENIADPVLRRDREFDRRALGRAAAMLIDAVDLELGILNRFPFELSRGQRQRVAFAQALIVEPKVLIVDEPTQGVDIFAQPAIMSLLERLNRVRQMSIVVISNELGTVERLTDEVLVCHRGFVIAQGNIDAVLCNATDPYLIKMREAREFARTPVPGSLPAEMNAAVDRVVGGLFPDPEAEAEAARAEAEAEARRRLLENRPEFARFQSQGAAAEDADTDDLDATDGVDVDVEDADTEDVHADDVDDGTETDVAVEDNTEAATKAAEEEK
ncbi:ATP-binding cassette domain-containing protein [Gulosibacter chungangensis]|uniref:ATP-binding cassette domain-containing protein n=1 Tax=Gulosibacter chungangensis TaxID=979746 RepID=A0A7J5BBZ2_9MICO|nr:ATP-binding cassette domain-containing protein [Gulosibacter chungangensis]KAB1643644.1 ATP-binding cassette domain-containing protein [Gulosibacter chungangensis]